MSTSSTCAIFMSISRFGCEVLVTHFDTVVCVMPSCSESHLFDKLFSARTTFNLLRFLLSILIQFAAKITKYPKPIHTKQRKIIEFGEKFNDSANKTRYFGIKMPRKRDSFRAHDCSTGSSYSSNSIMQFLFADAGLSSFTPPTEECSMSSSDTP